MTKQAAHGHTPAELHEEAQAPSVFPANARGTVSPPMAESAARDPESGLFGLGVAVGRERGVLDGGLTGAAAFLAESGRREAAAYERGRAAGLAVTSSTSASAALADALGLPGSIRGAGGDGDA